MDGVGAQFQRIVSVFAIAKLAKVNYLHSELIDIDSQVFSLKSRVQKDEEIHLWNSMFRKDLSYYSVFSSDKIINPYRYSLLLLRIIRFSSRFSRGRIIWKMGNPRLITDRYPNSLIFSYDMLHPDIIKTISARAFDKFKIVIHIRQGELAFSQFKDRLLPLSHYEKILKILVPIFEANRINYEIVIPKEDGQRNRISVTDSKVLRSIALDPQNPNLNFEADGFVTLKHEEPSFEHTPHLMQANWRTEGTVYEDFLLMTQADLLITSKSSLSFVAGLFNVNAIKVFTPFWHPAPSEWISIDDLPSVCQQTVLQNKIKEVMQARNTPTEFGGA
jgi:hypothetical protein